MINRAKKILMDVVLGLVALELVAGVVFATNQPTASAAANNQAASPTTTTPGKNSNRKELRDAFVKNFATQLGVDENKLNLSFTNAVDQTADQAVKDGKLTQAQADKIKERAKNGLNFGQGKQAANNKKGAVGNLARSALQAAADSIGIKPAEFKQELKQGKSIAEVAQEHNVQRQTVKDAMLKAVRADLDKAVSNQKLTKDQADKAYTAFSNRVDKLIDHKQQKATNQSN